MMIPLGQALIGAAVVGVVAFGGGWTINGWRHEANVADALQKALEARRVDEARLEGVSTGYQQIAAQMRRLAAVNRVETIREVTSDPAFDCPVPAAGQRLLDRAADLANGVDPGGPAPAVRPPAEAAGKNPG